MHKKAQPMKVRLEDIHTEVIDVIVDCYSMDVYCRHGRISNPDMSYDADWALHSFGEFPHTATGRTRGECVKELRALGWIFHRDGEVTCPKCAKKTGPNHGE